MRSTTELRQHVSGRAAPRAVARSSCEDKGMSDPTDKVERLAAALREYLKRRRTQARVISKPAEAKRLKG